MEKETKVQRLAAVRETDFVLQWGNRKRLRCSKVKEDVVVTEKSNGIIRKKITSRVDRRVVRAEKEATPSPLRPPNPPKNSDGGMRENHQKSFSCSLDKEERYYTTRGSLGMEENGKHLMETKVEDKGGSVWPRLLISLSSKEKEEDFMAMKGCKLPQRPKKRAKLIQRTLLLVSPGAWLSDLCQERYEVREKKTSKKRPRGLKAMGSMASDSELSDGEKRNRSLT